MQLPASHKPTLIVGRHTKRCKAPMFLWCRLRGPKQAPQDFVRAGSASLHKEKQVVCPPHPPQAGETFGSAQQLLHRANPRVCQDCYQGCCEGAFKPRQNLPDTAFRQAYERGDLPVAVEHRGLKNVIRWKVTAICVLSFLNTQCERWPTITLPHTLSVTIQAEALAIGARALAIQCVIFRLKWPSWTTVTSCPSSLTGSGRRRNRSVSWQSRWEQ